MSTKNVYLGTFDKWDLEGSVTEAIASIQRAHAEVPDEYKDKTYITIDDDCDGRTNIRMYYARPLTEAELEEERRREESYKERRRLQYEQLKKEFE